MRRPGTITASAVLVIIGCALPGLLVGGFADEIRDDLDLSHLDLGFAVATFWLAAAAASVPAGRVVDRFGATPSILLAGGLAAAGALSAAAARSPAALIAALAVGGSANAFATPGVSALTSRAIPRERQGLAFGIQLAGPAIAALLAGLALPLLAGPLGWRGTFVAAAALAILTVAAAPRTTADRAPTHPRPPARRLGPLVVLAFAAAAANAAAGALLTFLVLYGIDIGLTSGTAGVLLATAAGGAVTVRLGLGLLADHRPEGVLTWIVGLLALGAAGYSLVATATPALVVVGAIGAVSFAWGWPGLLLFATVRRHRADPGAAVGVVVTGFFAGAVLGPLAAGPIVEAGSYELLWWTCAALALLAAGAIRAAARLLRSSSGRLRA
jgi:MFS family permease